MQLFYLWGRFPTQRDWGRARSRAADLCLASGKSARQNCRIWNSKRYNTMIENSWWKETEFFTRENALLFRNLSIAIRLRGGRDHSSAGSRRWSLSKSRPPSSAIPIVCPALFLRNTNGVLRWSLRIFRMNSGIFQQVKTMCSSRQRKRHATHKLYDIPRQ